MVRVLIADDSEVLVQRLAATLLEVSGIEIVGQVGTVAETAEAVRNFQPDVVILDICMPGGSGINVLEGMKRDLLTPIVIVLTSYDCSQYRRKCLQLGARFFFDKSAEFGRVSEVLRSLSISVPAKTGDGSQEIQQGVPPEN